MANLSGQWHTRSSNQARVLARGQWLLVGTPPGKRQPSTNGWAVKPDGRPSKDEALHQITQRSQQWLRWHAALANDEGMSVDDPPEDVQKRLKGVERAMRRLEVEFGR